MAAQVALITGASSEIGKATAKALARRGLRVFAGVRRPEAGEELRSEDMADMVSVLLTPDARWLTGVTLPLSGGLF